MPPSAELEAAWEAWLSLIDSSLPESIETWSKPAWEASFRLSSELKLLRDGDPCTLDMPQLWQAATGSPGALEALTSLLKTATATLLSDPVGKSPSALLQAISLPVATLEVGNVLLAWRTGSTSPAQLSWCDDRWQPLVHLLLVGAPAAISQRVNQLNTTGYEASHGGISATGLAEFAAKICLEMAGWAVAGGAGAWVPPAILLEALSRWDAVGTQVCHNSSFDSSQEYFQGTIYQAFAAVVLFDELGRPRRQVTKLLSEDENLAVAVYISGYCSTLPDVIRWRASKKPNSLYPSVDTGLRILTSSALTDVLLQEISRHEQLGRVLLDTAKQISGMLLAACTAAVHLNRGSTACSSSSGGGGGGGDSGGASTSSYIEVSGQSSTNTTELARLRRAADLAGCCYHLSLELFYWQQDMAVSRDTSEQIQRACLQLLSAAHKGLSDLRPALEASLGQGQTASQQPAEAGSQLPSQAIAMWCLEEGCRMTLEGCLDALRAAGLAFEDAPPGTPRAQIAAEDSVAACEALLYYLSTSARHPLCHILSHCARDQACRHVAASKETTYYEQALHVLCSILADTNWAVTQVAEDVEGAVTVETAERSSTLVVQLLRAQGHFLERLAAFKMFNPAASLLDCHLKALSDLLHYGELFVRRLGWEVVDVADGSKQELQVSHSCQRLSAALAFQAVCSLQLILAQGASAAAPSDSQHRPAREHIALNGYAQRAEHVVKILDQSLVLCRQLFATGWGHVVALSYQPVLLGQITAQQASDMKHLLDILLPLSRSNEILALALCADGFLLQLAEFIMLALDAVQACKDNSLSLRTSVQQVQGLGCQLVKVCYQHVGNLQAGTQLLAEEQEIEQDGHESFRARVSQGQSPRAAALEVAQQSWLLRLHTTLPQLASFLCPARVTSLRIASSLVKGAACSPSGPEGAPYLAPLVLQRELASLILGCANPRCTGMNAAGGKGAKRKCAGCRGVLYCSVECSKRDWQRHRPCCKALRSLATVEGSCSI